MGNAGIISQHRRDFLRSVTGAACVGSFSLALGATSSAAEKLSCVTFGGGAS